MIDRRSINQYEKWPRKANSCERLKRFSKDIKLIQIDEFLQKKDSGDQLFIIDILPHDLFQQRHIPGAQNACVFEVSFLQQVNALVVDRGQEIVVYGSSGRSYDAIAAAEKLHRAGYLKTTILKGGIQGWLAADKEIVGSGGVQCDDLGVMLSLDDGDYVIDCSQSIVEWTGRNQNGKHFGILRFNTGKMAVQGRNLLGEMTVDMLSIENTNLAGTDLQPVLVSHLLSDDFFFVNLFPTATMKITEGFILEEPFLTSKNCSLRTELTLRGVKKEFNFQAILSRTDIGELKMEAHFDIDRTRWGVLYGSARFFEHLGMHTVYDEISLQLHVTFQKSKY